MSSTVDTRIAFFKAEIAFFKSQQLAANLPAWKGSLYRFSVTTQFCFFFPSTKFVHWIQQIIVLCVCLFKSVVVDNDRERLCFLPAMQGNRKRLRGKYGYMKSFHMHFICIMHEIIVPSMLASSLAGYYCSQDRQ